MALHEQGDFIELDRGFDIYATQTTALPDGRRILSGWMGLPEIAYPTEAYGYCGCLLLPRELRFEDGRLKQRPIRELAAYESEEKVLSVRLDPGCKSASARHRFRPCAQAALQKTQQPASLSSTYTAMRKEPAIPVCCWTPLRAKSGWTAKNPGCRLGKHTEPRRLLWEGDLSEIELALYLDRSSIELFLEDGLVVASSRIFPDESQQSVYFESLSGEWAVAGTHAKLDVQANKVNEGDL